MALLNTVRNSRGVALAAFLSSIDARAYADNEAAIYDVLTVEDFAGFVTEHRHGQPVRILVEGVGPEARKNITDNCAVAEQVA